jgi:putative transposase
MPYWRLHYHLIWATKNRLPLIDAQREVVIQQTIAAKTRELRICLHAVGGSEDHVHTVVSIPPSLRVSECVKHLKGATSRAVNRSEAQGKVFQWQGGYGAVTVGEESLGKVIDYVKRQREHHRSGTTLAQYECNEDGS